MTDRSWTPSLELQLRAALIEQDRLRGDLREAERFGWLASGPLWGVQGGNPRVTESGTAGFEAIHGQAVVQLTPSRQYETGLLVRLMHYSTGRHEAAVISRDTAMALHAWLGEWIGATWPDTGGAT